MAHHFLVIISLLFFPVAALAAENSGAAQNVDIHKRVQQAVPYALDQTLQSYAKTAHGGILHVVAVLDDNTQQIQLIKGYLSKIANDFKNGDFSATERIHGSDMPGLALLKTAKPNEISVDYKSLANGGQIHFSSEYPKYVQALHEWIDAQIADHGSVAIQEHSQHHGKPAE